MQLGADRDIRGAFGLTEAEIGRIIGKTRQAVNHGLEKAKAYFRPHEWLLIVLYLKSQRGSSLQALYEYLEKRYKDDKDLYLNIVSGYGNFNSSPYGVVARRIVVVVADYRHFRNQNPEASSFMLSLATRPDLTFELYTSTSTEVQMFKQDLLGAGSDEISDSVRSKDVCVGWLPEANQYPYLLCCDPATSAEKYFSIADDNFQILDKIRGQTMFYYVERSIALIRDEQKEKLRIPQALAA